ncbi:MAG TPA: hypothetical protein VLL48_11295, partial [Longimicrobiales bacterium]|nr:hypothetical protein [Longimicrobiales bacterium]
PAEEAPPVLLDALDALTFRRAVALGAAWDAGPRLTLTGDLRWRENGGMTPEPDAFLGVGLAYLARENVPIRTGVAAVERGVQLSAGAGLGLGRFTLSGAMAVRTGALDDALLGTFGASFRTPQED